MGTLADIVSQGLSIRQIPEVVIERWRQKEDGRVLKENEKFICVEGVSLLEVTKYPKHGGCWMVQKVTNTDSLVSWSKDRHYLSSTLEDAVCKYMNSL